MRKYANDLALADGVPLVDAGSSPLAAQVRTYYPGRTPCLKHRVYALAEKARNEYDASSCAQMREATLPGTNMICGGMLAAEALAALRPGALGSPSPGTITYDACFPARFGVIDARHTCAHIAPDH